MEKRIRVSMYSHTGMPITAEMTSEIDTQTALELPNGSICHLSRDQFMALYDAMTPIVREINSDG